MGGAAFSGTVAFECTVPFGAIGTPDGHKPRRHVRHFLGSGIEFGHLLTRIEEEARNSTTAGVDHDEVTCRFSVRSKSMCTRRLDSEALVHWAMLPRIPRTSANTALSPRIAARVEACSRCGAVRTTGVGPV